MCGGLFLKQMPVINSNSMAATAILLLNHKSSEETIRSEIIRQT
jgi:hypothetical protein